MQCVQPYTLCIHSQVTVSDDLCLWPFTLGNLLAATDDDMIGEVFRSEVVPNPDKVACAWSVIIILHVGIVATR